MQKQFVNKSTGAIVYVDDKSKEYKEYLKSTEWEQFWNLVVE